MRKSINNLEQSDDHAFDQTLRAFLNQASDHPEINSTRKVIDRIHRNRFQARILRGVAGVVLGIAAIGSIWHMLPQSHSLENSSTQQLNIHIEPGWDDETFLAERVARESPVVDILGPQQGDWLDALLAACGEKQ